MRVSGADPAEVPFSVDDVKAPVRVGGQFVGVGWLTVWQSHPAPIPVCRIQRSTMREFDLPTPPPGYTWEISPADWLDGDNPFTFPRRSTLTVWLRRGGWSSQHNAASSYARPRPASIRRAASRALRMFYRRARQSAKWAAAEKRRTKDLSSWTGPAV
jgi:hypothetical protein